MIRIAMWSGPRNISTAMMRSWENRKDTVVVDEPFYGPYLATTGKKHAAWKEIIADQGADWQPVAKSLSEEEFEGVGIYYQKHMSHHLMPEIELDFLAGMRHAFLIRHPNDVLSSYLRKHPRATPEDLGYPQQVKLFNWIKNNMGVVAPVMESKDILMQPEVMMKKLCGLLGVPFDNNMLAWPKGYRDSDGVWASHWYNRVIESTGFSEYKPKENTLTAEEQAIADACLPFYEQLAAYKVCVE
ncbi:HAD family hydrolase [Marinicella rhabdoformis]|uniref:sulfotransferase-like domain-containing protein n=1 Tax=Marinicella rhabdoformis TaxID=2580566 RepID=UPI0012AEDA43|nr:HAD family hydrolase [Marinicella rhabdoformis]